MVLYKRQNGAREEPGGGDSRLKTSILCNHYPYCCKQINNQVPYTGCQCRIAKAFVVSRSRNYGPERSLIPSGLARLSAREVGTEDTG